MDQDGSSAADLRDLKHVSWVAEHIEDYEFLHDEGDFKKRFVREAGAADGNYITRTLFYRDFCTMFDNRPYSYCLGLQEEGTGTRIFGKKTGCYLVPVTEQGITYQVPLGFLEECGRYCTDEKDRLAQANADECRELLEAVLVTADSAREDFAQAGARETTATDPLSGLSRERVLLFLAWLLCLLAMLSHPELRRIRSLFSHTGLGPAWVQNLWQGRILTDLLPAAGLLAASLVLLVLSVGLFRAHAAALENREIDRQRERIRHLKRRVNKGLDLLDNPLPAVLKTQTNCGRDARLLLRQAAVRYRVTYPPGQDREALEKNHRKREWTALVVIAYTVAVWIIRVVR